MSSLFQARLHDVQKKTVVPLKLESFYSDCQSRAAFICCKLRIWTLARRGFPFCRTSDSHKANLFSYVSFLSRSPFCLRLRMAGPDCFTRRPRDRRKKGREGGEIGNRPGVRMDVQIFQDAVSIPPVRQVLKHASLRPPSIPLAGPHTKEIPASLSWRVPHERRIPKAGLLCGPYK